MTLHMENRTLSISNINIIPPLFFLIISLPIATFIHIHDPTCMLLIQTLA